MKRFSIRALLIVTVLIAVFVARPMQHGQMQRHAREWVATQRGHSVFKYQYGEQTPWYKSDSELAVPGFLVRIIGIDTFNPVETVIFDCDELKTFQPLVGMKSLQTIVVNIEMSRDIEFAPLTKIDSLQSIHFSQWSFLSDGQLAEVRGLLPHVKIESELHPTQGSSPKQ